MGNSDGSAGEGDAVAVPADALRLACEPVAIFLSGLLTVISYLTRYTDAAYPIPTRKRCRVKRDRHGFLVSAQQCRTYRGR